MDMQSTMSASPAIAATASGSLSGLNAMPTWSSCSRAVAIVAGTSSTASKWKVTLSPPAAAIASKCLAGFSAIKCTSIAPPETWISGEIDLRTIGPIVIGSTKWPSPTSKWKTRQPARRSTSTCAPRLAKSAAYSDGSTSVVLVHSLHGMDAMLRREPGDEEPRRVVAVGSREQKLGPLGVRVLRPFLTERVDLEARGVDDGLILVGVQRADRVDDRPARLHPLRRRAQELELELGQRARAPAQVGPPRQHAKARAGRVNECAVEATLVELAHVRLHDADVRRHLLGHRPRTARVNLDRRHLPGEHLGLASGRRARVEDSLALLRADDEGGELGRAAHGSHARRVDLLDDVGAGNVGR